MATFTLPARELSRLFAVTTPFMADRLEPRKALRAVRLSMRGKYVIAEATNRHVAAWARYEYPNACQDDDASILVPGDLALRAAKGIEGEATISGPEQNGTVVITSFGGSIVDSMTDDDWPDLERVATPPKPFSPDTPYLSLGATPLAQLLKVAKAYRVTRDGVLFSGPYNGDANNGVVHVAIGDDWRAVIKAVRQADDTPTPDVAAWLREM